MQSLLHVHHSFTMVNDDQAVAAKTSVLSSRFTAEMTNNNNNVSKCMRSSNSLKRKRPSKLEIPNVLREICTDAKLDFDGISQDDGVCFSAPGVGVFSLKGKKKFMEDAHKVVSLAQARKGFFGVYDGHGGNKAAEFAAQNLHSNIYKMLENCCGNAAKKEAVRAAYLKTDQEFLKQGLGSGACCVTALIEGKEMLVSNLGDCRAVLCKGGTAEALTKDHKAGQEDERRRIEDQGGYVEMHRGAWRIHGILAVSRSIGDAHLKDWVLAEPDTKSIHLTSDMEYLVLASDGLWEEVHNQEAVNIVMQSCSRRMKENTDEFGCISPLSRSKRVVLVKRTNHSPRTMKTVSRMNESEDNFGCETESPRCKARRISEIDQMDQANIRIQSPGKGNSVLKAQRILEMDQTKMKIRSPNKENSGLNGRHTSEMDQTKMKIQSPNKENSDFTTRHISEMDRRKMKLQSPNKENSNIIIRHISDLDRAKMKLHSPNKETNDIKAQPASSGGLVAVCKELANLAVSRGSLDDITVMIIDLKQFMD